MNTSKAYFAPLLKQTRMRDYEFILEDLELAFPVEQLEAITESYNDGMEVKQIAKLHKRHEDEVALALFHQRRKGKIKERKRTSGLLVPGKVQLERKKKRERSRTKNNQPSSKARL